VEAANAKLVAQLGRLDPGDAYFGGGPMYGNGWSDWSTDRTLVPKLFPYNLRYVHTFITNNQYDAGVSTPAIAAALRLVDIDAGIDQTPRAGVERPGWLEVSLPASDTAPAANVEIRFPSYEAGHMVTLTQAQPFHDDVLAFLREAAIVP
jgi:hypothetical protein